MSPRRAATLRAAAPASFARALALALALPACSVEDLDVTGMPCPCPSGFACDGTTQTCTRSTSDTNTGAGGSGGGGGGSGGAGQPCPPDMVHATDGDVSFCIDRTEVTQDAYVSFLQDVGTASNIEQPEACAFNTELTHTPDASCPTFTAKNQLPVWCVDWCDARAFCAWAGKRLCGKIGGGSLSPLDPAIIPQDEWYFACSRGAERPYPYGAEAEVGYCNIPEENTPANPDDDSDRAEVGSFEECQGGFDGIFDMQGNVAEWTDWCESDGDGTGSEECYLRGGHTFGTAVYWSCDNVKEQEPRNQADRREAGFRCCKDAVP